MQDFVRTDNESFEEEFREAGKPVSEEDRWKGPTSWEPGAGHGHENGNEAESKVNVFDYQVSSFDEPASRLGGSSTHERLNEGQGQGQEPSAENNYTEGQQEWNDMWDDMDVDDGRAGEEYSK